ncbi:MINDY family deubiquitinase [Aspergillus undulatus]|uniref:MINDY family deubiquitinase n=1 Tax=Aspergillus undulatus TaxID=1810928 RepID=UPI003CCCD7F5
MVLRKRAPPHLHNLSQGNARFDPRSSVSRTSPTSQSLSSHSPKRLTRPSRAQSSPHPRRIPSQESIFSPDLNTSPAFDLMSLEQAQRSPIRTSSTDNPNPWADELVENPNQSHRNDVQQSGLSCDLQHGEAADTSKGDRVPQIVLEGTQRRIAANELSPNPGATDTSDWEYLGPSPVQLQSNNPFLKPSQHESNAWAERNSRASSLSRDGTSGGLGQDEGYIPMTARLSLFDQQIESESPWANESSVSQGVGMSSQQAGVTSTDSQGPQAVFENAKPPLPQRPPEQIPPQPRISTPGTLSTATTGSSRVLIDFDDSPTHDPGIDSRQRTAPIAESATTQGFSPPGALQDVPNNTASSRALDEAAGLAPPPQQHPVPATPDDDAQQQEKRAETYSIRHISWKDTTGTLRESPMLIQNKNGPCPLLALVNALILRAAGHCTQPPIVRALRTREQISLGLLIQALFDELTTRLGPDDELPDIEALSRFLTMLHTGMNVNPRLTSEPNDVAGTFLQTEDIKFYSTFGVPLVHGWIASPSTDVSAAMERVGQHHEDIQLLPFRKQELEDRVFQGTSLTTEEERIMADIQAIQHFTEVENATQLSAFGLEQLTKNSQPGTFSILFRNDHFSTLYKHPQLQQLFTLVTDAGYSNHAEVVWESLVDVNGSNAGFYAGDFRLVSHNTPQPASDPSGPRTSSNATSQPASTLSVQEQVDADYAYALSLQYQEEEQRQPQSGSGPARGRSQSAANLGTSASTPAVSRQQRQSYGHRSSTHLQPRTPANDNPEDGPPPSYEQAAKSPVYTPEPRSPSIMDGPPRVPYSRNQNPYNRYPERGAERGRDRNRERDRDCIVM